MVATGKEENTIMEFALKSVEWLYPVLTFKTFQQAHSDAFTSQYDENYGQSSYTYHEHSGGHNDDKSKGVQNRKRHVASEPSSHVIFLGLDTDYTEADVCLLF